MAWNINRVVMVGRLARDIELTHLQNGNSAGKTAIAVNKPSNAGKEEASFFNITIWGQQAVNVSKFIHKGDLVAIDGYLDQQTWTNKEGVRQNSVQIVAQQIQILTPKQKDNTQFNQPQQQQQHDEPINRNEPFDEYTPF